VYVDVHPLPGPAAGSARAGMFARGEFDLGAAPALTIPQTAVVVREGFSYVFRVNPDHRVSQVKIQAGRIAGDRVQVLSGVAPGMRLVASGGGFLNEGDLVRVTAEEPPAPNPAPGQAASAGAAPASGAASAASAAAHGRFGRCQRGSSAARVASAAARAASAAASAKR